MKHYLSDRLKAWTLALLCLSLLLGIAAVFLAVRTRWLFPVLGIMALQGILVLLGFLYIRKPSAECRRRMIRLAESDSGENLAMPEVYRDAAERQVCRRLLQVLRESNPLELSKRQAQYLALQNQINPHFLYNTMESIRSEAMLSGLDSVARMCESLASFFRYTVSNTENLVTLEAEIQNVRTYFYIQQYRFGSRLQLKVEYEEGDWEEMLRCRIPKLTLQPLVENAIIHGVEKKIGQGTVTVRFFFTGQRLVILVKDDGVGIPSQVLAEINRRLNSSGPPSGERGGIAVANVNTRIRLLFGDAYGLTVYSAEGIGTDVEISLPRYFRKDDRNEK